MGNDPDEQHGERMALKAILGWGLFGVIAVLAAAWLVWYAVGQWRLQLAARSFVETEAVITASRLGERQGMDHRQSSFTEYEIYLSLEFDVKGNTHRITDCRWGPVERIAVRIKDDAEEIRARTYTPGSRIALYYDPADPTRIAETRETSWGTLIVLALVAIGAVLLVGGMVYWGIATLVRQLLGRPPPQAGNAAPPEV